MYCGSCLHGNTLAAALRARGEDVLLVPVYTPLRTDEEDVSSGRLAMGGINVYLQEKSALFRHAPRLLDRLLDWPRLVRWAARRGTRTRPEQLGPLTVSVLRGQEGRLRKEVEKLLAWLERETRPDIIHLSNVLLAGIARPLRERIAAPVVCTLSGEDSFLERLTGDSYRQSRAILRQRAGELDGLVALSRYYADFMADYLAVPRTRIHVIPPGLNLDGHRTHHAPRDEYDGRRGSAREG
jgi:glycosyltransferase involved in cell wall biosynthesis